MNEIKNTYKVSGITCQACTKLIVSYLSDLKGVTQVNVDLSGKMTLISTQPISLTLISQTLRGTDYLVSKI